MNRRRFRLPAIETVVTVLFVVVASLAASSFVNSWFWLLNLAAQFRLVYVPLFALCVLWFAVRRRFAFGFVAVMLCVANALPLMPSGSASNTGTRLRLLQMNIWVANHDYNRVAGFIRKNAPDVVAVEEFNRFADEGLAKQGLWKEYPYRFVTDNNSSASQIGVLSRVPLQGIRVEPTYKGYKDPSLLMTINVKEQPITLVVMHPRLPGNPGLFARQCNHLCHVADLRNEMRELVIVAGDFNTSPWTQPFSEFLHRMDVRDTRCGNMLTPTYPTWLPFLPIDYVLCSPAIGVEGFRTLSGNGSDHRSVLVDLMIPRQ